MTSKESFFKQVTAKVGRMLASTKNKDRDIVGEWEEVVKNAGLNKTDVLLGVMRAQLEQGGIDPKALKRAIKDEKLQEAMEQVDVADTISKMANQFVSNITGREQQHLQQFKMMQDQFLRQIKELVDENQRLQREIANIKVRSKPHVPAQQFASTPYGTYIPPQTLPAPKPAPAPKSSLPFEKAAPAEEAGKIDLLEEIAPKAKKK